MSAIVRNGRWLYLGRTLDDGVARIQLCGPLKVRVGGEPTEGRLPGRQGQLLLGFLILNRGRPQGRDRLVEAVWPLGAPAATDSALSALLSKLRRVLPDGWIEGRSKVELALPESAFVDLEAAREAIHRAESAIAMERWADAWGPARVALHTANRGVLPELEAPWIDDTRHEVEGIQQRALECVAAAALGLGGPELASAERAGRKLIELSPYNEAGYVLLMEALAARDRVPEALQAYERLRHILREELGIPPGKRAQQLHHAILDVRQQA